MSDVEVRFIGEDITSKSDLSVKTSRVTVDSIGVAKIYANRSTERNDDGMNEPLMR